MTRRTWASAAILIGLLGVVALAVLFAPSMESGRPHSSYSAGLDGLRLARDLGGRLGWPSEAREVPFADTLTDPAPVQVLVAARVSAVEAHALLEFVRGGGGLLVAGPSGALDDSLPLVTDRLGEPALSNGMTSCPGRGLWPAQLSQFTQFASARWRRPAPPDTVGFGRIVIDRSKPAETSEGRAGFGFPMGRGRIVAVADENFLVNDVIRRCELAADVTFIRMLEYLTDGARGRRIAFDEYHHGYGVRGGSIAAIRSYLSGTPSGRMLAQMSVAGLLMLLAFAPRPLAPRDPTHVARRSPIEHADALAHAYAGVNATRTATSRLVAGVRRRTRRDRRGTRESNEALLATAASLSPEAAAAAGIIGQALERGAASRDLPEIAAAVQTVEQALTQRTNPPLR
jgi:hypothetical protein